MKEHTNNYDNLESEVEEELPAHSINPEFK